MEKLHPRALIFDLGSTLIEYEAVPWDELGIECVKSARSFLIKKGFDLPDEEEFQQAFVDVRSGYRQLAQESLVEWDVPTVAGKLFDKLEINHDEALVDGFFDAYYEPVDVQLFIYDDVLETLERLKDSYPLMGLVSNTVFPERAHLNELKRFGIEPFLDFTVFSSTFKLRKPHPDIFYHAVNLAGCAPKEALYVGDRYVEDIEGPEGIGMAAILKIKSGREYPPEMPEAVRKINAFRELTDHLEL